MVGVALRCPPVLPENFMDILNQLGSLVLGSVPTAILFILLVILYGVLVRGPLERTLAERRKRTTGAVDEAKKAIGEAEAQTAMYEEKLRAARATVVAAREKKMKELQAERDRVVEAARGESQRQVANARAEIAASSATAQKQVAEAAEELGAQIVRTLLPAHMQGATK
jgi:F-type H+-transporting ATPase subunit b